MRTKDMLFTVLLAVAFYWAASAMMDAQMHFAVEGVKYEKVN